jgi:hypothetical protein
MGKQIDPFPKKEMAIGCSILAIIIFIIIKVLLFLAHAISNIEPRQWN